MSKSNGAKQMELTEKIKMDADSKSRFARILKLKERKGIAFGSLLISMSLFGMLSAVAIPNVSHFVPSLHGTQNKLIDQKNVHAVKSKQNIPPSDVLDEYTLDSMLGVFSSDEGNISAKLFANKKALSPSEMEELIGKLDPRSTLQKTIDTLTFNSAQSDTQLTSDTNLAVTSSWDRPPYDPPSINSAEPGSEPSPPVLAKNSARQ